MSVRKRKWITAKGVEKEAWVVDYVDGQGVRRLKTFTAESAKKTGMSPKKAADAFAATANVEIREGTHVAESASTTIAAAGTNWIATAEGKGLERGTVTQYRQLLDHHIKPHLGATKLSALNIPTVRAFEDRIRAAGTSAAMTRKVLVALGSLLADAQERGHVARNVVRDMRGQRRKGGNEKRQKRRLKVGVDIPTREEIKAIVGALEGHWRPILLTAIFTGLRASELRGLRWSDVDFEKRDVHVQQRADRFNEIGRPKSEAGDRHVPIPPIVINTLKEWKLVCPRRATGKTDANGDPVKVLDLVFPNGVGKVESIANIVQRGLHPAMLAADVSLPKLDEAGDQAADEKGNPLFAPKYTGMHSLRHFYASWCINRKEDGGLGLPPKVVQERLGHSSITLTMDVYGHLFPRGDDAEEMASAEQALLA